MIPNNVNKTIHEPVRLMILSALAVHGDLSFQKLKQILKLTDGNLSVHASILEGHGLIRMMKRFEGRKPRTTYSMTTKGRTQLHEYITDLETMLDQVKNI